MADNELYSAYHWAKKAEDAAEAASGVIIATTEALDNLWDDIDAGLFGDSAKTGTFYLNYRR